MDLDGEDEEEDEVLEVEHGHVLRGRALVVREHEHLQPQRSASADVKSVHQNGFDRIGDARAQCFPTASGKNATIHVSEYGNVIQGRALVVREHEHLEQQR